MQLQNISFTACEQPSNFHIPQPFRTQNLNKHELPRQAQINITPSITSPLKSRVAGIVSAWCLVLPVLSTCCPLGRQITTEGERHHDWGGDWCDHSSPSSLYTSEIINTAAGRRRLSLSGYQWWLLGGAAVTRTSLQHCSTAALQRERCSKWGELFSPCICHSWRLTQQHRHE